MSKKSIVLVAAFLFLNSTGFADSSFSYPKPKCGDQVDDYHGTKVRDPFRWMENVDSPETRAWIDAEIKLTSEYLSQISGRDALNKRLKEVWDYERYSLPTIAGNYYVYGKNDGLQNQNVLYRLRTLKGTPELFFDPNKLSHDGTVTLGDSQFTQDGTLWAYSIASAGSDRSEWKFMKVASKTLLKDTLSLNRYEGLAWMRNNSGVFYTRFPNTEKGSELKEATRFPKVYFHQMGTPESSDKVIFERPENGELVMSPEVSDDGRWLIISTFKGTERMNEVAFKDLKKKDSPVITLVGDLKNSYTFVGNDGSVFYFVTDRDAPQSKIVKVDALSKNRIWIDVVPESQQTLNNASLLGDKLFLNYLSDAHTQIKIYRKNGRFIRDVALPGIGTTDGFHGKRNATETFYNYTSFNAAPTIYHYKVESGKTQVFKQARVSVDMSEFAVKQEFYKSKDGTRVPMFIVHKKGIKLDGSNPTLLYGYGGFNISLTPSFSASRAVWLERGGVFAVANLRGGAEYGKAWWQGGSRLNKQNVFDDFIAAAEWLIANKYTSKQKLAIEGRSNGGLLIGAVLNQRPDLFGAAIAGVGVMDMLRFDKFTIGYMWKSDYGSPDVPADFNAMYAYSPYQNVQCGTKFPATLITTADHDDRVFPAHSFKYTAAMQAAQAGSAPVLIRIETKAGHGAGKPTSKIIEETADIYAFLFHNLNTH